MSRLKPGEKFYMPGTRDMWEVLTVDDMAAVVRPVRKRRHKFETRRGEQVEFDAPAGSLLISANSDVDRVLDVQSDEV